MKQYKSNTEFIIDLRRLIVRLDEQGNKDAAQELRSGCSCLNGLTDGYALLMESIDRTLKQYGNRIRQPEKTKLRNMLQLTKKAVNRR
jgi:regulatory protein YycH of two-component signal transduction system YycFG